jgi:hypothetical protein
MLQDIIVINLCLTTCIQMGIFATLGLGQAFAAFLYGASVAFLVYTTSSEFMKCLPFFFFPSNNWVERHHLRSAMSNVFL